MLRERLPQVTVTREEELAESEQKAQHRIQAHGSDH